MWSLADYVKKGIQVLDNDDTGFFLMCEGGKIDWACHANDAASTIHDTLALADAVQIAIDFAEEHAWMRPHPGHRRPRDRRADDRLRWYGLRHLPLPAGQPKDFLRQI
ncbi:MAG: alkaline phosphatase [Oscillospiraceae bacterium]